MTFLHLKPIGNELRTKEAVILIHGLLRTRFSLARLGYFLTKQGYDVYLYGYRSHRQSVAQSAQELRAQLIPLMQAHPDYQFHFVTHSLGGLLARDALCGLTPELLARCASLVLLAPPNCGAPLADQLMKGLPWLANWLKPLPDLCQHPNAYVHQIQTPALLKVGVIAAQYDVKAPAAVTRLQHPHDFLLVITSHAFIMNHPDTRKAVLQFLSNGQFLAN